MRCIGAACLAMLLYALAENCAIADGSTRTNEVAKQIAATSATIRASSSEVASVIIAEQMKTNGFVCDADGIWSKPCLPIKELKAVLGVDDLKGIETALGTALANPVYVLRVKGASCVIKPTDRKADISDDNTVVAVDVNTNTAQIDANAAHLRPKGK